LLNITKKCSVLLFLNFELLKTYSFFVYGGLQKVFVLLTAKAIVCFWSGTILYYLHVFAYRLLYYFAKKCEMRVIIIEI